ncbi:phenylalanine--tRNA ligase subunit beta [Salinisphaera sp. Q1T1-3]|uniref:phenylalanine--tRNA ligase subunit beta n=1 Tax=Salinisphaera sp. Q1T1-3 TaxID=2321229 RepID=UPI000E731AAE|nr:phenylalanine--tRNA ligase subunit beta [Salinisphaera sp. Q1T1-3]RJS91745.1 phenylalanine--tRNA ligase subunit beta [Salinisphaera sp. Q1T1-3]
MKVSEQWLREWVDTTADLETIADRLTMLGLEVDSIDAVPGATAGVVIGRVATCEPHPDADKLSVCTVDTGDETAQIVCGAPNVAAGIHVPVATVGTHMPGGMKIKKAKLRGVESRGMLCSAAELGISGEGDGLWLLPATAPVGTPLVDYLGLPDTVLDVDLTPNRGDCLSMRGIAREVAIGLDGVFDERAPVAPRATAASTMKAVIEAPDHCAAYGAQYIEDIDRQASTPLWMAERLRRAGVRVISLPVDIGNYVMLEYGQPMHAFDADKLVGTIRVRLSRAGEQIETLDNETVTLDDDTLVIADDHGPVAMAGMIGGARTAVGDDTRRVLFESACFVPAAVVGRGRRYKIHTDSLHRFERGVDPALPARALARASGLLMDLAGGACGPATIAEGVPVGITDRRIDLAGARVTRLLGQAIDNDTIARVLDGIGCRVETEGAGQWRVTPPSWRYDLAIEADLVEEIARVYGYDRLETERAGVRMPPISAADARQAGFDAGQVLRQRGYSEAITYSFVAPGLHDELTGSAPAGRLDNPISDQMVTMRRTLWAGLLEAWAYNTRRQQTRVRLYEEGLSFVPDATQPIGYDQQAMIAGLLAGSAAPTHWGEIERPVDFFDIRGDVEALFGRLAPRLTFTAARHPALHPGRCARIHLDETPVGWVGQLAPTFARRYKNQTLPYLFEIFVSALPQDVAIRFDTPSDQPQVRRDLALVVPESVTVGQLRTIISGVEAPVLRSVEVFDVFRGQGLEEDHKSIALSLIFQDKESTLSDESVEEMTTAIVAALRCDAGARLRGE